MNNSRIAFYRYQRILASRCGLVFSAFTTVKGRRVTSRPKRNEE